MPVGLCGFSDRDTAERNSPGFTSLLKGSDKDFYHIDCKATVGAIKQKQGHRTSNKQICFRVALC